MSILAYHTTQIDLMYENVYTWYKYTLILESLVAALVSVPGECGTKHANNL